MESCSEACSPSRMCSELVDARIDATVGLQMSQPFPVPNVSISPEKVRISVALMISNSSARDWREVLAQRLGLLDALGLQQLLEQRHAGSARRARQRALLQAGDIGAARRRSRP